MLFCSREKMMLRNGVSFTLWPVGGWWRFSKEKRKESEGKGRNTETP